MTRNRDKLRDWQSLNTEEQAAIRGDVPKRGHTPDSVCDAVRRIEFIQPLQSGILALVMQRYYANRCASESGEDER